MNSRQRFLETMRYGNPDRVPYFEDGLREGVLQSWRRQGMPRDLNLSKIFTFDGREEIEPDIEPRPDLRRWPTRISELDMLRQRLDPDDPARLPGHWRRNVEGWKDRDHPLILRIHQGLFLSLGVSAWNRFAEVICQLKEDPKLVHETMAIQGNFSARLAERILREVQVDAALFVEPIGGNDGPLISPQMYEEFCLRHYEPVLDVFRRHGVDIIIYLSFANPRLLLSSVVKRGFNCLWACEVNMETMDYRDLRSEFGRDLRLIGGIDLDALRLGKEAIRREIEKKVPPLLDQGGYIPLVDGRVREDVPYENYVYYRHLLEEVTRR